MPEMEWVMVDYPIAGLERSELEAKAKLAYPEIVDLLTRNRNKTQAAQPSVTAEQLEETIRVPGSTINEILEKFNLSFNKLCWSDGLPLVPPTREAVNEMLSGISLPRDTVIGLLYPNQGKATVEKIAINAVMAGCRPDYMPILVAAIKAITSPEFNQEQNLLSTGSFFPVVVVNGPIAKKVNINSGRGIFGPGWRANATIGRAVRLIVINIGGAWPDVNDMGVMGHPAKYTCCIAENEASSPWPSLSEELGYPRDISAVTVMPGMFMGYLHTVGGQNAEDVLQPLCEQLSATITTSIATPRAKTFVVLNPVHARMLHKMGLSKQGVKQYIYENARHSSERYLRMTKLTIMEPDPKVLKAIPTWPGSTIPMHESIDQIRILVAGAEGTQGVFIRVYLGDWVTCQVQT